VGIAPWQPRRNRSSLPTHCRFMDVIPWNRAGRGIVIARSRHSVYTGDEQVPTPVGADVGWGKDTLRLPIMLHATNADGKPDSNDSPLSLAEIRRILHEAANPCYWITGLTLWKRFHADRDVLPDHAEVYRRAATQHCAKFYIARHDLLGRISPATWAALPLDGESWQAINPDAAARACAAALAELVCAEAASHSAPPPTPPTATAPTPPAPTAPTPADSGPATPPSDPPAPRRKGRGANIDARMFKVLSERPESLDWSCRQWAEHLGCACSTVAGTTTWKIRIPQVRSLHQAERIRRGSRR